MKRICNKNYFEKIDTEAKAYILGFIYADGCIINSKTSKYKLSIGISNIDREILEFIVSELESNHTILVRQQKGNRKDLAQLDVCSKIMYNDLLSHNLSSNKSLNCISPNIDEKLVRHFIRGYFDGDGCVCDRSDKNKIYPAVSIIGSNNFLKYILDKLPIKRKTLSRSKNLNDNMSYIKFSSKIDVISFYNYMYDDSNFSLKRKKDKFEFLINNYGNNKTQEETSTTKLEPPKV